jgi:hypothetical protein
VSPAERLSQPAKEMTSAADIAISESFIFYLLCIVRLLSV